MIEILGYVFFILAGLFFGLFGSGGSIIIIPILVYIFKLPIYEATTYSLLLVFLISLFGTIKHIKQRNLHIQKINFFIISTLIFTSISRVFLFPEIPEKIVFLNVSKDSFLMILFSIVIFFSGASLLRKTFFSITSNFKIGLICIGILIGLLTGLLGIGGGFIIVPALVLFARMNMKRAASTALFIIMLNTLLAIILEISIFNFQFNWLFILFLLISALIGITIGIGLLNKIEVNRIKKMFSFSLLLLSLLIFCIELF